MSGRRARLSALCFVCMATGVALTAWAQEAKPRPRPTKAPAPASKAFRVEIEQDGRSAAPNEREVLVGRRPFALNLTLPDKTGVFVHVSFDGALFEAARGGQPFTKAQLRRGLVGAEGSRNASRELFVSAGAIPTLHFWDCATGDDSSFDGLTTEGAGCRGRRSVEKLFIEESVPLDKVLRRPLHFVFFRGELGSDGPVKETGRDWLKVHLGSAPESAQTAARDQIASVLDAARPLADREASLKAFAAMGREGFLALDAAGYAAAIKAREAGAVAELRTLLAAEAAFASANGGFYDGPPCLIEPRKCLPRFQGAPFLSLETLETRNGYKKLFLPGRKATPDQIKKAKASSNSMGEFVVVAWPEVYGETGERAFCADESGKICYAFGASPPAKDGRCLPSCTPLP